MVRIINSFWKHFPILVVYTVFCFISAPAAAQVGTAIASGQTVTIDAHGECRKVSNTGSGTRMVFTGTAAEWQSFRDTPNGLGMGTCETPCEGAQYAGFCWYLGGLGESCTSACASRGGVNLNGIVNYTGSGGNNLNCLAVARAVTGANIGIGNNSGGPWGCTVLGNMLAIRYDSGTTADAGGSDIGALRRVCSCNN